MWFLGAAAVVAGAIAAVSGFGIGSILTPVLMLSMPTAEAKEMTRRLAREEGLFAGTSSGAHVIAAIRVGQRLGPDATVVTLMCDSGLKYVSTDVYRRG